MREVIRREWKFILLVGLAVVIFFPEIALLKKGFLSGDHRLQHYPWFSLYAEGIKKFSLPWWTTLNQCGFPLLAEGQIGAFYPLNLLFSLLPVRWGYNYSVLAHYFLGGVFFYLYCRKIGIKKIGAFWGTLLFLFGSSQGGFFYNITSQRVLIWFPLTLLWVHRILEKRDWKGALTLGVLFALESVAGYQQYAVYAIGFTSIYFLWFWWPSGNKCIWRSKFNEFALLILALFFSVLVALPQWFPFLELSRFSSRENLGEAFAYIGSMNPLGPLTLFFPSWQGVLSTELYVGILGIFFALLTLWLEKGRKILGLWILFLFSLLLAWGECSPLYVALIKLSGFYGFRIPTKFLFFSGFFLSVLSAWGLDQCLSLSHTVAKQRIRSALLFFVKLIGGLAALVAAANLTLRFWKTPVLRMLEGLVQKYIVGQPYRFHSAQVYLEKLHSRYESTLNVIHPFHPWMVVTFVIFLLSIAAVHVLSRQRVFSKAPVLIALFGVLFCDLYVYGYRNIRGDYETFSFAERPSEITTFLKQDPSLFRIYVFNPRLQRESVPLASNSNIVEGIENIGIYSPLAFRTYKSVLEDLGAVDDSISRGEAVESTLYGKLDLLRLLNVRYVLSETPLHHSDLKEVSQEGDFLLYKIENSLSRFLFLKGDDWKMADYGKIVSLSQPLETHQLYYRSDRVSFETQTSARGLFLTSDLYYPGWKARVDGKGADLLPFLGLFRGIEVPQGMHRIELQYRPTFRPWVLGIAVASLFFYFFVQGHNMKKSPGFLQTILFSAWAVFVMVVYLFLVIFKRLGG